MLKMIDDFLRDEPEKYDLRQEVFDFEGETCIFEQYLAYKGTPGKEADACDLLKEIWETLFQASDMKSFNPLDDCTDSKGFHGDTMNSVQTTLNQLFIELAEDAGLLLLKGRYKWSFNACKTADKAKVKKVLDNPMAGKVYEFLKVSYTIGNFIPWPVDCNSPRGTGCTKDYWDLALKCIYDWYHNNPDLKSINVDNTTLFPICGMKSASVKRMEQWLTGFKSWDNFVKANYMQPFVEGPRAEGEKYGPPKELWKGHFGGPVLPDGDNIGEFFTNAAERIQKRSELMVHALRQLQKKESGKNHDLLHQ